MKKQAFPISFKKEVIEYMEQGKSCYKAAKYFSERDGIHYNRSMFQQWFKNRKAIKNQSSSMKRVSGGGRKTSLGDLEELILDEILELRLMKVKVTRTFISDRAIDLARSNNIDLKATGRWVSGFMERNGLSLRRTTNFTTLSDEELIQRAVLYMNYLQNLLPYINPSKTLLMDETAVYFEDNRTQTVDIQGRRHVIMKATGFASMRITVAFSVWADGRKALPLVIHKGRDTNEIKLVNGVFNISQSKAWVNQELIIKWIDIMFPRFDVSPGKCIVWDSCRAHISTRVKEHCRQREIKLVVIPGGLTPYLQAGDIGIFREFKDRISSLINIWKHSSEIEYTRGGNPKPPVVSKINSWVKDSCDALSIDNVINSIKSAGFSTVRDDWHISKHDIYGAAFKEKFGVAQLENIGSELVDVSEDPDIFDLVDE